MRSLDSGPFVWVEGKFILPKLFPTAGLFGCLFMPWSIGFVNGESMILGCWDCFMPPPATGLLNPSTGPPKDCCLDLSVSGFFL